MNTLRQKILSPKLFIILSPILLFWDSIFTGKVIYWGTAALQFIPWRITAWEQVLGGELFPLWNPLNGLGSPLLANYQLAWFYPPSWMTGLFYLIGGPSALAYSMTLLVVAHLIWAGWGMSCLLKRVGVRPFAQTIGAMAFMLSGYIVARASFFSMVWAYAWLPWILYQSMDLFPADSNLSKGKHKFSLGLVVCISMQLLAGHAQLAWYSMLLAAFWVIWWGWRNGGWSTSFGVLVKFIGAGLFASLLAAVQLLPTAEYLFQSSRSSTYDINMAFTYSFWPWRVITFIAPDFFGNPGRGDYWGYAAFWEDAVYIGIIPLLLALSTLRPNNKYLRDNYHGLVPFLWLVILSSFILALGKNTPVFPFLFRNIPTFDMFQAPARYLVWMVFALSILSGLGANDWKKPTGKSLRWLKIGIVGCAALIVGSLAALILLQGVVENTSIISVALFGCWALGTSILTFRAPWRDQHDLKKRRWEYFALGWVALDLIIAGYWLNPVIRPTIFSHDDKQTPGNYRLYMSQELEYFLKFNKYLNFNDIRLDPVWYDVKASLLPNLNLLDGVQITGNFDPLLSERFTVWMNEIENLPDDQMNNLLNIMAVDKLLVLDESSTNGFKEIPNENASRVYWYPCVNEAVDSQDSLFQVIEKSKKMDLSNPASCAVIEGVNTGNGREINENKLSYNIAGFHENNDVIEFTITTQADGWVVLSDLWYPYWNAYIDGEKSLIYPANYLFKGIPVSGGVHKIIIKYQPLPFYLGIAVSLVSVGLLLILLFSRSRKREVSNGKQS